MAKGSSKGIGSVIAKWHLVVNSIEVVAGGIVGFMMVSTVVDTVRRYIFGQAILGVMEVNSLSQVIFIFLAMAGTQMARGHIRAVLFIRMLPPRVFAAVEALGWTAAFLFFLAIGVRGWEAFLYYHSIQEVAWGAGFPIWWVRFFIPFGCLLICLQLLSDIVLDIAGVLGRAPIEKVALGGAEL